MGDLSAGVVVIGNEILSGKVVDTNSPYLASELRSLGVTLQRIATIPDELPVIAKEVSFHHETYDIVFTSGGVGPTHDDVTMEGIALALGRKVIEHPDIADRLRAFYGDKINAARLKMAEVPEGAELVFEGHLNFPIVQAENIFILPGIPELFREKFLAMKARFAVDPYFLRVIYMRAIESSLARHLNATLEAFPDLQLGSYPKLGDPEYSVRVTLESKDQEYVNRAFSHLLAQLPPERIVRTE
jgi:FAD synthetase